MARVRRHKHHSRKHRSSWAVAGAFVASTAFVPRVTAPVHAAELAHTLSSLRIAVPAETRLALKTRGTPQSAGERPQPFTIAAGRLGSVLAELERLCPLRFVITSDAIREIASAGLSGVYTPSEALAAVLAGTGVTSRVSGANIVTLEIRLAAESVDVAGAIPLPTPSSAKYAKPLTEVPQTIAVIPADVMQTQGVTTLSEALRNVPGITLQAGEGGGASNTSGDMFNLRGFSAANSVFVDGVRDDGLMSRDVFNLEQVEVFMGPAGADVGRGNAAGYVNMETKAPRAQSSYAATYGYGSAHHNRSTLDLNHALPVEADATWLNRTAFRLNALWQDGGVPGRQIVEQKNQAIAPSIAIGLNTSTRVILAAQLTRQDNIPDYGIPGSAWSETLLAPTTVIAARPVDPTNFYGSVGYDYDRVDQKSYTARVEHDRNRYLTLRNQTRYNRTHREAVITAVQSPASFLPDTQTVTLSRQGNDRENRIVSNQSSAALRFDTGRLRHAASAGLEIAAERQFAPSLVNIGIRNPTDIYDPSPFDVVTDFHPRHGAAYTRGTSNTVGVYAFDTVDIGQKWQVSGGLRWEHYDASFEAVDASGAKTADLHTAGGLFSGKAGVLYKLTDQANLYASIGSSVTPPGTANFTLSTQPNNQNNPNVKPQESRNYEIGTKMAFYDNRLSFNAAAFRTDNENVIFTADATAIPPVFNQDDAQRVSGVTMGTAGRITGRWQVMANAGYLNTRQLSQTPANNGRRLTLTPEFSGSVWSTFDLPLGVTVGGGVRFTDDVFVNAANTIRVPGYALADMMVEYDLNTHLSLRLNVTNLTDERYIRNVNNNGGRFNPGAPRAATLTSSVRF